MVKIVKVVLIVTSFFLFVGGCFSLGKFETKEQKAQTLDKSLQTLQQQYIDLSRENEGLKAQINKLTSDLAEVSGDRDRLVESKKGLEESLKSTADAKNRKIVELSQLISDLERENTKLKEEIVNLRKVKEEEIQKTSRTYEEMLEKTKSEISKGAQSSVEERSGTLSVGEKPKRPMVSEPTNAIDVSAFIKNELGKFSEGRILYNPPDKMRVGAPEKVEVRISKNIKEDIKKGLKGSGTAKIETLEKVGTYMTVKLWGDAFSIEPKDLGPQFVSEDRFTEWAWKVTPLKSGKQDLHLKVSLRIKIPGNGEEMRDWPEFYKEINVEVNPPFTIKEFMKKYWQWIITALILPFLAWAWKIFSNNRDTGKAN